MFIKVTTPDGWENEINCEGMDRDQMLSVGYGLLFEAGYIYENSWKIYLVHADGNEELLQENEAIEEYDGGCP